MFLLDQMFANLQRSIKDIKFLSFKLYVTFNASMGMWLYLHGILDAHINDQVIG